MLLVYLTFGIVKVSAILFYKRIFTESQFRLVANIMMAVVVCWTIAQFIVSSPVHSVYLISLTFADPIPELLEHTWILE